MRKKKFWYLDLLGISVTPSDNTLLELFNLLCDDCENQKSELFMSSHSISNSPDLLEQNHNL